MNQDADYDIISELKKVMMSGTGEDGPFEVPSRYRVMRNYLLSLCKDRDHSSPKAKILFIIRETGFADFKAAVDMLERDANVYALSNVEVNILKFIVEGKNALIKGLKRALGIDEVKEVYLDKFEELAAAVNPNVLNNPLVPELLKVLWYIYVLNTSGVLVEWTKLFKVKDETDFEVFDDDGSILFKLTPKLDEGKLEKILKGFPKLTKKLEKKWDWVEEEFNYAIRLCIHRGLM